nr:unnamed protein product [Salmo salar]|eukprot:XP_014027987.1 PREDICTED: protein angel homolog 1-like [Salmo salar]
MALSFYFSHLHLLFHKVHTSAINCPRFHPTTFPSLDSYCPTHVATTTMQAMISGQEDLSYNIHDRRVFAPLWPSTVGIDDNCQYTTTQSPEPGNLQYNHDFLRQLRFCEAACIGPHDLELFPRVTDNTPEDMDPANFTTP